MLVPSDVRHLLTVNGIGQIKVFSVHGHIFYLGTRNTNVHGLTAFQIL